MSSNAANFGSNNIVTSGNLGVNTYSPSYQLDVAGTGNINLLKINDQYTFPTGVGSVGDSLVYTGSNQVAWSGVTLSGNLAGDLNLNNYDIVGTGNITVDGNITAEYFYGDLDGVVITECRNGTAVTISEGTPVYVSGYYSSNGKPLIAEANASSSSTMPAIGLLASDLASGTEGHVHVFGLAQNLPSGVTNGFSVGETVYVAAGGGLTNVRPTGVSELVQNMGRVLKTGTNGRILVLGPGRSNDVPNSGHFEQLTVDGQTILAKDGGNVGIGTASPQAKLDVNGSGHFQDSLSIGLDPLTDNFGLEIYKDKPNIIQRLSDPSGTIVQGNWYGDDEVRFASIAHYGPSYNALSAFNIGASGSVFVSYEADIGIGSLSNDSLIFGTYNIERARITQAGYFGIGTDNPTNKLQVENGNVVLNDLGGTYDFRVEGDADPQLLTVKGSAGTDKVGIGCSPSLGKLHIQALYTNNNGHDAIYIDQRNTSSSNGSYSNAGIDLLSRKLVASGVTDTGQIVGADLVATLDGDGSLNNSYGARTWGGIYINNSGSLTNAWGIQPRVINGGYDGASITNAYGVDIFIDGDLYDRIDGNSITTAMGLRIRNIEHAANKWAIYQEGVNDDNYFAGNVGIGTASPSYKLDVNGSGNFSGSVTATSLIKSGGTSSQFLKADGSVDGSTYAKSVGVGNYAAWFQNTGGGNDITYYGGDTKDNIYVSTDMYFQSKYGMRFRTDAPVFGSATERLHLDTSEAVFNDGGNNYDFRVEGDADTHLLCTDASTDRVGIGTSTPTEKLDVNSDAIRIRTAQTPASATATGNTGDICWDSNYIYVCVATNTWKRSAISTW